MAQNKKKKLKTSKAKTAKSKAVKPGAKTKAKPKAGAKKAKAPQAIAQKSKSAKSAGKKSSAKSKTPLAAKKIVVNKTKSSAPVKTAAKSKSSSSSVNWNEFITPLDDRLIVEMNSNQKTTASGLIIIPDTVADTSGNLRAKVLVVGRGHLEKNGKIRPMDVRAGDTVVFSSYAGSKIDIDGQEVMILRESDVLGIVGK